MSYLSDAQRAQFAAMRRALDGFVVKIADSPAEVNDNMAAIRPWHPGPFERGDVRMYADIPRFCKQSHDSTDNKAWNPTDAPALWGHYHGTTPETARPFEADSANVYKSGEYAIENGNVYRNLFEGNAYAPSILPERWEKVAV